MKWLFVICAPDDVSYRKQKKQWKIINSALMDSSISITAVAYREAYTESIAQDIFELDYSEGYDGVLVAAGDYTEDIAGRYAALKECRCILGISGITRDGKEALFYKSVYQANMEAAFRLEPPFALGLAQWRDREVPAYSQNQIFERIVPEHFKDGAEKTLIEAGKKQKESDVLLVVGKGVRSKEEVQKIKASAISRGYMFGVTRPVAMNGWALIDEIVGVSGHIYSPEVCITVGVSGSAAFYAGIENSGFIASVNHDECAPIIGMSDIFVIDDYENILERLFQVL